MTDEDQDPPRSTALELAPRGSSMALATPAWALAQRIADTDFVPSSLRGKKEAVLACILTGHEIGVSPMQALAKIHVIDGRPAMAAELMRAVALKAGHEIWIEEQSSTRVVVGGKRKGSDRETKVCWTMDDAKRANLEGRSNWKRYPSAMLLARATAALCRAIFPDVLAGISYTTEELADGDVLDGDLLPEPDSVAAREAEPPRPRARARRAATAQDAPAEAPDAPTVEKTKGEAPLLPGEEVDEPAGDDDVVDAVIVGDDGKIEGDVPPIGEGEPPIGDDVVVEEPDQTIEGEGPGPSYSGPQIVSMKANDFGLNRGEKIYLVRHLIGRVIDSTTELTPDEVTTVLEVFADDERAEEAWTKALAAGEFVPPAAPEVDDPPAKRTRRPLAGPESWDAPRWREFLRERGVKVAEVLSEASRLAREGESKPPTKLDEISESGLAATLVGFVEDLSAERGKG